MQAVVHAQLGRDRLAQFQQARRSPCSGSGGPCRALIAASVMCFGVLKSGSPAPKLSTSTPCFFSALAWLVMESVSEGESSAMCLAMRSMRACVRGSEENLREGQKGEFWGVVNECEAKGRRPDASMGNRGTRN